jgi:hypothetical protein
MPSIPSLSEFIKCNNLSSCFQELYNFLFALFILLAFLSFLYGAFLYLLSAGGVYDKEKGKNKMKNSIIALLVALIVPIILNMINPGIFRGELKVPQVEVTLPEYKFEPGNLPGTNIPLPPGPISGNPECKIPETGDCSPDFLKRNDMSIYDNDVVKIFSLICINESGGNRNTESSVDKCLDNNPFSIGLFQINMVATYFTLQDGTECRPDLIFQNPNPNNPYGCSVKNKNLYNKCKEALKDPKLNITIAKQKYNSANGFSPWSVWPIIKSKCLGQ